MRPLIPKARIGDVLVGTRNLRRYLYAAATLSYLEGLKHTPVGDYKLIKKYAPGALYRPSKKDRFLVAVNSDQCFAAYGLGINVVLLFCNSDPDLHPAKTIMNPTIFPYWFIRTPERITNLKQWPDQAHWLWISLHLKAGNIRHPAAPVLVFPSAGFWSPFLIKNNLGSNREQNRTLFQKWVTQGITRNNSDFIRSAPPTGYGPMAEDIPVMKKTIQALCSNPRIARHLGKKSYQAFMKDQ